MKLPIILEPYDKKVFTFQWRNGQMDIPADKIMYYTQAELKNLLSVCDVNLEEIKAELADFFSEHFKFYDEYAKKVRDKKTADCAKKFYTYLALVQDRPLTKAEKTLQKVYSDPANKESFRGVFQNSGKYCVCNSYIAFRFDKAPMLPMVENDFRIDNAFGDISLFTMEISLPTAKILKEDLNLAKKGTGHFQHVHVMNDRKTYAYDFGYGLPMVDTKYLLDMLSVFPDCKAFINPNVKMSLVYIVSGDDDGLILPLRKSREFEKEPAVDVSSDYAVSADAVDAVDAPADTKESIPENAADNSTVEPPVDVSTDSMDNNAPAVENVTDNAETSENNAENPADHSADDPVNSAVVVSTWYLLPAHVEDNAVDNADVVAGADSIEPEPDNPAEMIISAMRALYFNGTHTIEMLSSALYSLGMIKADNIAFAYDILGLEPEEDIDEYEIVTVNPALVSSALVSSAVADIGANIPISDSADSELSSDNSSVSSSVARSAAFYVGFHDSVYDSIPGYSRPFCAHSAIIGEYYNTS